MNRRNIILAVAAFLAPGAAWAPAQQCDWLPGEGVPTTDGPVYATITWDPDGSGPEPELLIVGGDFTVAGDVVANNIAAWNGGAWQPLASGMNGGDYPSVSALTVYNGELIAGGNFSIAGGVPCNNIARWNGSAWQPLGTGTGASYPYVYALTVYNGDLIAGGEFTTAGGVTCNYIARWDGSTWQPLGSGMGGGSLRTCVRALTTYNGELIAGGDFTSADGVTCYRIACWNGSIWQPLGLGIGDDWTISEVRALAVYSGELITGGDFTTAGGLTCVGIARWNGGAWQPLGSGVDGLYPYVCSLTTYRGELIVGGIFTKAGGVNCNRIARWSVEGEWQPLGSGMNYEVYALTVYNADLIAGGWFTTAGGYVSRYWARWSCPACAGDLNCDGFIDFGDINPFVMYLSNCSAWLTEFAGCDPLNGDINGDGAYGQGSFDDINPFVDLLMTGQGPCP